MLGHRSDGADTTLGGRLYRSADGARRTALALCSTLRAVRMVPYEALARRLARVAQPKLGMPTHGYTFTLGTSVMRECKEKERDPGSTTV